MQNGVKFTQTALVGIERAANGQVVFIERGNAASGLQHIIQEHGEQFIQAGVPEDKIPDLLMQALKSGKIVGQQSKRGDRPIYEVSYEGKTLRIAITTGSNGYVVGANMQ